MTHYSRLFHGTLIVVLLGLLPSACRSVVGNRLEPAQVARVRGTLARSYIPERQIKIMWVRSHMGGGLGLMGGVINRSVDRGRRNAAEEMVLPLQAQSQDVNYQWMFWHSLEPTLRQVPWLKLIGLEGKPEAVEAPSYEELVQHSLVRMGTGVFLSVDSSTLVVKTGFEFFEQGGSGRAAAATIVYYRSEKVGQVEDEKAIGLWSADRAARYRMALAEGVAENVKMIGLALFCMGGMNCPFGRPHHLRFRVNEGSGDLGAQVGVVDADGTIVEEGPYRLIFRGVNGIFYSLPRGAIESQSGHGPPPAPVLVPAALPVAPVPPPTLPPAPGS